MLPCKILHCRKCKEIIRNIFKQAFHYLLISQIFATLSPLSLPLSNLSSSHTPLPHSPLLPQLSLLPFSQKQKFTRNFEDQTKIFLFLLIQENFSNRMKFVSHRLEFCIFNAFTVSSILSKTGTISVHRIGV